MLLLNFYFSTKKRRNKNIYSSKQDKSEKGIGNKEKTFAIFLERNSSVEISSTHERGPDVDAVVGSASCKVFSLAFTPIFLSSIILSF